jgi:dTDP-glucose pyrophosphorylase
VEHPHQSSELAMARIITDFASYLIHPDTTLREVMARINQLIPPMLIVATEDRRFLGTITDGDIRRALLRGGDETSSAQSIMQANSITGFISNPQDNRRKLDALEATIRFLPVLENDRRIAHLLLEDGTNLRSVTALVMAGGFGRRLGDLTVTTPKPLLHVKGRPILDHVLGSLEDAGIRKIFVSTHYLADKIEKFIAARDNFAEISLIHEERPLGTGGSIGLLPAECRCEGEVVVLNGDLISDVSFDGLLAFHRSLNHNATVCVKEHRTRIEFGVVRFNDNSEFERIDEKPELSHFIAAGIYLLDSEVCSLAQPGAHLDMPDLVNRACGLGFRVGVFPVHERWADIGRPKDLHSANEVKRQGSEL